jgi:O-acetyl-ADP-ribose deacetylase (regulator of RNase III)
MPTRGMVSSHKYYEQRSTVIYQTQYFLKSRLAIDKILMNTPEKSISISLSDVFLTVKVINCSLLETNVDVIVNAANCGMRGGGGIDGAIHQMAGPQLLSSLEENAPNGCETGEVVVTDGFNTGFKYIFHTPGPMWMGGDAGEAELLSNSYWNCLNQANYMKLKSIGFCSISTGVYSYPLQDAANIAVKTVVDYVSSAVENLGVLNIQEVVFAMYTQHEYEAFCNALDIILVPWANKKNTYMPDILFLTALRYLFTTEIYNQEHFDYVKKMWSRLSKNTKDCIFRDIDDILKYPQYNYSESTWQRWKFIKELNTDENNLENLHIYEPFVVYSVKYTAGRMTYFVSWVVEELEKNWSKLSNTTKQEIKSHISHKKDKNQLGMDCDIKEWNKILDIKS